MTHARMAAVYNYGVLYGLTLYLYLLICIEKKHAAITDLRSRISHEKERRLSPVTLNLFGLYEYVLAGVASSMVAGPWALIQCRTCPPTRRAPR